jgi:hypothetical protein
MLSKTTSLIHELVETPPPDGCLAFPEVLSTMQRLPRRLFQQDRLHDGISPSLLASCLASSKELPLAVFDYFIRHCCVDEAPESCLIFPPTLFGRFVADSAESVAEELYDWWLQSCSESQHPATDRQSDSIHPRQSERPPACPHHIIAVCVESVTSDTYLTLTVFKGANFEVHEISPNRTKSGDVRFFVFFPVASSFL